MKEHFVGKRITVMGLGLLGRGVGDAAYLASCGADLVVTDIKNEDELRPSLEKLRQFPNIRYSLAGHKEEDFKGRDMILKAAGVPNDSPFLMLARSQGIPVRMSADLFAEHASISIIGVTGTRGKSTVTHMIYSILKEAEKKVLLGGNVRGISTLALLSQVQGDETAVLELDSWQCQGFGEAHMSPHIAVFTTFMPDHMNYYRDDMGAYLSDKAHIFLNQKPEDELVLGEQARECVLKTYTNTIQAKITRAGKETLPAGWTLSVPGEHNRYNAGLALAVARICGVSDSISKKALEEFGGLPGRIEFVCEKDGIRIYNDTNSTTAEATVAALRALDPQGEKKIVLITGGADKGLDMSALIQEVPLRAKRIIMLAGTGTNRVVGEFKDVSVYDTLKSAFEEAMRSAEEGDVVLLSPAFASFGMFNNEYDRGDQFVALAKAYE